MLVEKKQYITIDFYNSTTNKIPRFFQYDNNILVITVFDNGVNADLSNVDRILLNFRLVDGSVITRDVTANLNDNVISYTLGTSEQKQIAIIQAELQIYDNTDRLSTFIFKIKIDDTINPEEPTEDEQTIFNQLIAELNALNIETTEAANYAKAQGDYAKEQADHIGEISSGVISVNGKSGIVKLNIADMNDASVADLSNNDMLAYDSDSSSWINIKSSELAQTLKPEYDNVYANITHSHTLSDVDNGTEMTDGEIDAIWAATTPA